MKVQTHCKNLVQIFFWLGTSPTVVSWRGRRAAVVLSKLGDGVGLNMDQESRLVQSNDDISFTGVYQLIHG